MLFAHPARSVLLVLIQTTFVVVVVIVVIVVVVVVVVVVLTCFGKKILDLCFVCLPNCQTVILFQRFKSFDPETQCWSNVG